MTEQIDVPMMYSRFRRSGIRALPILAALCAAALWTGCAGDGGSPTPVPGDDDADDDATSSGDDDTSSSGDDDASSAGDDDSSPVGTPSGDDDSSSVTHNTTFKVFRTNPASGAW